VGITLAAATIFVVNNERQRVNQADIIEIVLGTYERCLATQHATNPAAYRVAPPDFTRSWYSNAYETTNIPGDPITNWSAVLYTNIVTNAIGWRLDRAMMVSLDTTIKALVPWYVDTNTVYDGTTNIVMLTVTGLWASLGIGDHTNKFTRTPEIVTTNLTTNAATYGDWPWRIYKEDLEERYKVLNTLKMTTNSISTPLPYPNNAKSRSASATNWAVAKNNVDAGWETQALHYASINSLMESAGRRGATNSYTAIALVNHLKITSAPLNTNLIKNISLYIKGMIPNWLSSQDVTNPVFNAFGYSISTNWSIFTNVLCGYSSTGFTDFVVGPTEFPQPGWCEEPTTITLDRSEIEGWEISDYEVIVNFTFNYCTNKYWN